MEGMLDLERLLSRVTLESANPRDLLALAVSFAKLPGIRAALSAFRSRTPAGPARAMRRTGRPALAHCLSLEDEPPLTLSDGGVIRTGVDKLRSTNCAT